MSQRENQRYKSFSHKTIESYKIFKSRPQFKLILFTHIHFQHLLVRLILYNYDLEDKFSSKS